MCVTRVARTSGPYRWTAAKTVIRFPAAEVDPGGRTIPYRYRGYTSTNRVVAGVDCQIPATDAAVSRMNRRLKVDRWHRVGSGSPARGARRSVGGTSFGDVALLPVAGVATWCGEGQIGTYPNCFPITSPTVTGSEGDPDGWDWGGSDGGDEGTEPDDGTDRPECARNAAGQCVTREVSPSEWDELLKRIEQIKDSPEYCKGAKDALRSLASQGPESQRLRFWDGYDMPSSKSQRFGQNLSDSQGRYIEYDSYWVWNMPALVAHEGIHLWLSQNADSTGMVRGPDGMTNEDYVHSIDQNCV